MEKPTFEIEEVKFDSDKWKNRVEKAVRESFVIIDSQGNGIEDVYSVVSSILVEQKRDFIESEIKYWKDIFDKRPKDRYLESDVIAQNFARIEIERLVDLKIKL